MNSARLSGSVLALCPHLVGATCIRRHTHTFRRLIIQDSVSENMTVKLVCSVLVLSVLFGIIECNQQLGNSTHGRVVIPAMAKKAGGKLRPEFTQPKKLSSSDTASSTTVTEDSSEGHPPISQRADKPRSGCKNGYMPIVNSSKLGFRCVPKNCPYGRNMKTLVCDDSGYGTANSWLLSGSYQHNPPKSVYRTPRYQKPRRYWSRGKK